MEKPRNKFLINLVCSVCVEKYLSPGFTFPKISFLRCSADRKPQANTFRAHLALR